MLIKTIGKQTRALLEENKKEVRALIKEQTAEIERHEKMLLEEFQRQLGIIAEVQFEQGKKIAKIDPIFEMVAKNTEDIELIKGMLRRKVDVEEFEELGSRVAVLEKRLKSL